MSVVVRIMCGPGGSATPHDGRYVVRWNPHTPYGVCRVDSTDDIRQARRFANAAEALAVWNTVSHVDPVRFDGKANKPLAALTIDIYPPSKEEQK